MAVEFFLFRWDEAEERITTQLPDYGPIVAHTLPRVGERIRLQGDRFFSVAAVEHHVYKLSLHGGDSEQGRSRMDFLRTRFGYVPFSDVLPDNWTLWGSIDVIHVAVRELSVT